MNYGGINNVFSVASYFIGGDIGTIYYGPAALVYLYDL